MSQHVNAIALDRIVPGKNDRTVFEPHALRDLALSILEHGLLQPATVRPLPDGRYQIVAGERRWRAHRLADELLQKWAEMGEVEELGGGRYRFTLAGETYLSRTLRVEAMPCIVRADMSDEEASAMMLAENVARENLDPIDEAQAYRSRMARFGWDAEECAQQAGVTPVRVKNRLGLLSLREDLQKLVRSGDLTVGYAQILAEASLDANRQLIVVSELRKHKSPNLTWFRAVVNALLTEQVQEAFWDLSQFMQEPIEVGEVIADLSEEPPHPNTTEPPAEGATVAEVIANQVRFWEEAACGWAVRGQAARRQECEAAATALSALLAQVA